MSKKSPGARSAPAPGYATAWHPVPTGAEIPPGAQMLNGKWLFPVFGCDSLDHTVDDFMAEIERLRAENAVALDALKLMADQYLEVQIDGREVYDHRFMAAGEACLDVLISAGVISEAQDYRGAGQSHNEVAERRPSGK